MTDEWQADPRPGDGADGRGESGPSGQLETRREAEEAARTGRFPHGDDVKDDSNPIEAEDRRADARRAEVPRADAPRGDVPREGA